MDHTASLWMVSYILLCYFNIEVRHHWLHNTVLEMSNHGNVL